MTPTLSVETPTDNEIVMTREFSAPRGLVFKAMTQAEHIREWWGWSDWTMPVCEMDCRPGGSYRFLGRGPNGEEVPFKGDVLEVEEPSRIVYTEIFDVAPYNQGEPSVVTTVFEDLGGSRTRIVVTCRYENKMVRDAVLETGMERGAAHSYDRLADLLERIS
ncbi:MAG TPA: SRPBCC family protein [Candidatus Dormibacteraeota bacterium]